MEWKKQKCSGDYQHVVYSMTITLSFVKQGAIDFSFFRMYVTYWPWIKKRPEINIPLCILYTFIYIYI